MDDIESFAFAADGAFPNSCLPVLIYRAALPTDPQAMIAAFATNGWSNAWRNGIYPFRHFHSIAHEVLGIAAGTIDVLLGGPSGRTVRLAAGDVVVIPAGVAHRNVGQRGPLHVVGAYPGGADWDLRRGVRHEYAAALQAAGTVSPDVPDPVDGGAGRLAQAWMSTEPAISW